MTQTLGGKYTCQNYQGRIFMLVFKAVLLLYLKSKIYMEFELSDLKPREK
jgi:hypothetical protein